MKPTLSNAIGLLKIAKCPNCDGSKTVVYTDQDGEILDICPCQWCYEREELIGWYESELENLNK